VKTKASNISNYIDAFIVLDDSGEVKSALSGIPVKVKLDLPQEMSENRVDRLLIGETQYAVWRRPIRDGSGPIAGEIIAFDDISRGPFFEGRTRTTPKNEARLLSRAEEEDR